MPSGNKRKRGGRKPTDPAASAPSSKPENGGSDGPSPRKKNKSASQSTPAPVPEPVKEEVVTTGEKAPEKGDLDNEVTLEVKVKCDNQKNEVKSGKEEERLWERNDIDQLLDRLTSLVPGEDSVRYNTQADRMDWEKIRFGTHTAEECKSQWNLIITKVRRFRTMTELLIDAKQWSKQPWTSFNKKQSKHPDMPKKPLTPYFRYFMEKRAKYSQQHPDLSMTEISMVLAQRYRALPDKKKQKYIDAYNKESEEHKVLLQKFKTDHPDLYMDDMDKRDHRAGLKGMGIGAMAPPKTSNPMTIYIECKSEEHRKKENSLSKKELHDLYKMKWAELPDSKKLKYINKAVEAKTKYDEVMKIYCIDHPNYQPKLVKSFLNKYEQKIKDKHEGKPEKPPPNGYGLFTSQVLSKLTDIPSNERMAEVSRRWKALKEEDRNKFNINAVQKMTEFKVAMQAYLRKLPEAEREKLALDGKKLPNAKVNAARFKGLDEQSKDHAESNEAANAAAFRARSTQFPGEPRKPPGSGYQLYSTEMLVKLKDIHSQQRMAVISKMWKAMTEAQRNAYKSKREKLYAKYLLDLKKFRTGLSKTDLARYEELEQARKLRRNTVASKATKKPLLKKVEESEDESSDDDDDDSDADDSDADSDADSDSASESDDESDSGPPKVANGPSKEDDNDSDSDSESDGESGSDSSSEVATSSDSESESAVQSDSDSDSD